MLKSVLMMNKPLSPKKIFNAAALAVAACAFQGLTGRSASAGAPLNAAVVSTLDGGVEVGKGGAWRGAQAGEFLTVGAQVRTGAGGKAVLVFANGAVIQVGAKTTLSIDSAEEHSLDLGLAQGRLNLWVKKTRKSDKMIVRTPAGEIKDIGTDWGALYCQNDCGGYKDNSGRPPKPGLYVDVTNGKIVVSNAGGSQSFSPGQFGFVTFNTPPVILPPANGVPISTDKGMNAPPQSVLGNGSKALDKSNKAVAGQSSSQPQTQTKTPPPQIPSEGVLIGTLPPPSPQQQQSVLPPVQQPAVSPSSPAP